MELKIKNFVKLGHFHNKNYINGVIKSNNFTLLIGGKGIEDIFNLMVFFNLLEETLMKENQISVAEIETIFKQNKSFDLLSSTEITYIGGRFTFEYKNDLLEIIQNNDKCNEPINFVFNMGGEVSIPEQIWKLYSSIFMANRGFPLFCTTYSPYVLNALTLAIKAKGIKDQNIVPKESCIDSEDVSIYELTEDGSIRKLPMIDGLPSDNNYLNNHLAKSNQLFDRLLELEESCLKTI